MAKPRDFITPEEFSRLGTIGSRINQRDHEDALKLAAEARRILGRPETEPEEVKACAARLVENSLFYALRWRKGEGTYWRARRNTVAHFAAEQDLWAPPPEKTTIGRANLGGAPVLYLASTPDTAIFEVGPLTGDLLTLGCFESREDVTLLDVGCSERCLLGPDDFKPHVLAKLERSFGIGLNRNGWRIQHVITDAVTDIFTHVGELGPPERYRLGAVLADRLISTTGSTGGSVLDEGDTVDGLMYPSVSFLRHGHCLALNPRAFSKVALTQAFEFRVIDVENFFPFSIVSLENVGALQDGRILWKPATPDGRGALQRLGPQMPRAPEEYVDIKTEDGEVLIYRKFQ